MNKKQRDAFEALIHWETYLDFPFDSSSQKMEQGLKKIGIKSPIKLYYDYKFPYGHNAMQHERIVQRYFFVLYTDYKKIIMNHKKYCQDWYDKIMVGIPADSATAKGLTDRYKREYNGIDKYLSKLTDDEKREMVEYIDSLVPEYIYEFKRGVGIMKGLNPELNSVRVNLDSVNNMVDFHMGVNYGFAPEEIDYFLNVDMETRNKETGNIYAELESFGVCPEYLIRPDRARKILDAVREVYISKNNNQGLDI